MKFLLFCLLFSLAFAVSVHAANLNVPVELPANLNWSFSVDLDSSDSFSDARIVFDDKQIAVAYSNSIVSVDPFNGQFVLKAFIFDTDAGSNSGLKLFVSMIGLEQGSHKLRVDTMNGSEIKSRTEKDILAFAPLSESYSQKISADLESLSGTVVSARTELQSLRESLEKTNSVNKAELSEELKKISSLEATVSVLERKVSEQQALLQKQGNVAPTNEKAGLFSGSLLDLVSFGSSNNEKSSNAISGFFTIASAQLFGLIILVVLIAVGIFFFVKSRSEEISIDDLEQDIDKWPRNLKEVSEDKPKADSTEKDGLIPLAKMLKRKDN